MAGQHSRPPRMLTALALTYAALVVLERAAAGRAARSVPWNRTLTEAAQALAIGLAVGAIGLALIGFLGPDVGLHAAVGRVVMEGLPFGLGVVSYQRP